jgi:hypothetical protein
MWPKCPTPVHCSFPPTEFPDATPFQYFKAAGKGVHFHKIGQKREPRTPPRMAAWITKHGNNIQQHNIDMPGSMNSRTEKLRWQFHGFQHQLYFVVDS